MELNKSNRGSDRRGEARKALRTGVVLTLAGRVPMSVRSLDLCGSGMCLISEVNIPAGTKCSVGFALALRDGTSTKVQTSASVAYSVFSHDQDGFKIGLQFGELPSSAAASIARFVGA